MRKSNLKGFTLLEVLIALLILGIGMSFIFSIFPLGIRMSKEVQILSSISFFAQKKIEELKTMNETPGNSSGQENNFNWTVQIEDYTTENNILLKKLQLDTEWSEGARMRKKSFVTYFKH
ncbi:MAG: type II secretion system protein [Candidatus Omnitrophica bacterium]|nr:type II secretion system protein [Candidatus Omnitrophota bacterium]MDD5351757.1 type II secretion system protein [Candidatus Omnitrophota bacterium]MDD5550968.1 type II secretion system protein [Candidatus Omnitrophota bacterium]